MSTPTLVLGLNKPLVGMDRDTWGTQLNQNADILDLLVGLNRTKVFSWDLPIWPGAPGALTFFPLGFERLIAAAVSFTGVVPVPVTVGVAQIQVDLKTGTDFEGTLTLTGDSRHLSTGIITIGDTEVVACDTSGRYTSQKAWVGTVTITPADLTVSDADVYAVALFNNAGQPFDVDAIRLRASSEVPGLTFSTTLKTWRRETVGLGLVVSEILGGKLDIGATPAGSTLWDLPCEPGAATLNSDKGEGLVLAVTVTGVSPGAWLDLQLQMNYKIQPNS